jgi:scyllo-inosamine 4-kinase
MGQMFESEADHFRDPAAVARCARVAARVFERHSVDFSTAQREGGWSNATWSAGGLVLRVAVATGTEHLRREARLASVLPPEVGYPPIVESSVCEGVEWVLSGRVPGRPLNDVWPALDWAARGAALGELWAKARILHSVAPERAQAHVRDHSPLYAPDPAHAAAQLARLRQAGVLSANQVTVLSGALDRFWDARPLAPRVLNHGDLCSENALWDAGHVVALLDLEYALLAPVELDLNELVKAAYAPPETPDPLPDLDGSGLAGLRQTVADIVVDACSTPGAADRLLGFAILVDLWCTEKWLSEWQDGEPNQDWAPHLALATLADGAGGYLAPVLARLDRS